MQPDEDFTSQYSQLRGYDSRRSIESTPATHTEWPAKLWVLGISQKGNSKAYSWNSLLLKPVINDTLGGIPVLLLLENDSASFHAYRRDMGSEILQFTIVNDSLRDANSGSSWNYDGLCTGGTFKGQQLQRLQAYQEYWHSWKNFHPATTQY
jgi:hypothetical protein